MPIHVPTDLEDSILEKVESGQYDDPSEVIRAAMRLLDRRDQRLQDLRALVAEGLAAAERGEVDEFTPELMAKIDREADEMIRLGVPPDPDVCP
jgi:antitoxin ParD1/3/4